MVEKHNSDPENRENIFTYNGVLDFFSETGTEGGYWAFQDEKFINDGKWSREGLHILDDGDELTIYDKKDLEKVIWQGTVSLTKFTTFDEDAFGWRIHSDQNGIKRETWAKWFMDENPAKLTTKI